MTASPPIRVILVIGTPLTIGMSGLAVASLVQSGLDLGWVPKGEATAVGLILISVPFVLQLLACVFSYLARDGATGHPGPVGDDLAVPSVWSGSPIQPS